MKNWEKNIVPPTATIHEAIKAIDSNLLLIALVVDPQGRLLGTITDGDVRRTLLKGGDLNASVCSIMNIHPTVARIGDPPEKIFNIMKASLLRRIPILDDYGRILEVASLEDYLQAKTLDNWVVLMAGGLGSRLRPLTNDCPKPLLPVGQKPILETILEGCRNQGFRNFFISVNYKAEMVKNYFGDGSEWNVNIEYLHEDKKLGTAGALSLLPEKPEKPVLVMNGDLLTKVNFLHLMDFHECHEARATMCVRESSFQIPFGVVEVEEQHLKGICEKPDQRFLVNAGIYYLNPESLRLIPENSYFDMPCLFEEMIKKKMPVVAFPIREYWMDIGRVTDLEQARYDMLNMNI